jgi:hypothetical protein
MEKYVKKLVSLIKENRSYVIMGVFVFLLLLAALCSCDKGKDVVEEVWEAPSVYGLYKITEGTEHIEDSEGEVFDNDVTDYFIEVGQSGNMVSSLTCIGSLVEGETGAVLDCGISRVERLDMWVGVTSYETTGTMEFSENTLKVLIVLFVQFADFDYSYEITYELVSELE